MLILAALSAILTPALLSVLLPRVAPATDFTWTTGESSGSCSSPSCSPRPADWDSAARRRWARGLERPVGLLANALLLALVGAIVVTQFEMLATIRPRGWFGMGLLLMAGLGLGWSCGGPGGTRRRALATTTATRNVALGLVIVGRDFAGTPAVTAGVACGLVSILGGARVRPAAGQA